MFITIDWDFFFNEDSDWDFGHNSRYPGILWYDRDAGFKTNTGKWLRDILIPDKDLIKLFNNRLKATPHLGTRITTIQNHKQALGILKKGNHKDLINFDAHWDVVYDKPIDPEQEPEDENWLGYWLYADAERTATIVLSPYSHEKIEELKVELPKEIAKQVTIMTWADWLKDETSTLLKADHINYCLSPGWTPPWADDSFIDFVNFLMVVHEGSLRKYDVAEVENIQKQYANFRNLLKLKNSPYKT